MVRFNLVNPVLNFSRRRVILNISHALKHRIGMDVSIHLGVLFDVLKTSKDNLNICYIFISTLQHLLIKMYSLLLCIKSCLITLVYKNKNCSHSSPVSLLDTPLILSLPYSLFHQGQARSIYQHTTIFQHTILDSLEFIIKMNGFTVLITSGK